MSNITECFKICKNIDRILVAYNANIDYIKHINKNLENLARKFNPTVHYVEKIITPIDLFSGIMYSIKHGEGIEIGMEGKIEKWLQNNLKPDRKRIGGQAGIMSNYLSILGITPIVHTPLLSSEQKNLFRRNIFFVDKRVKKWSEVKKRDSTKINWIFQYDKGNSFLDLTAKRTNRFIASSRHDEFRMKKIKLDFDFNAAILSGFHSVKERYNDGTTYKDQFKIGRNIAGEIKKKGKQLHIEFAYSSNPKINFEMLKLASLADSIGMDEQDLMNALKTIGKKPLVERIHKTHSIKDIFAGMKVLSEKLQTRKIHLHGRGYFLSFCKKGYIISPYEVSKSMKFASIAAAAYAKYDIKKKEDIKKGANVSLSKTGIKKKKELAKILCANKSEEKSGVFVRKNYDVIFVPNRTAEKVRDVVGLGDIISASIFACETGSLLQKK